MPDCDGNGNNTKIQISLRSQCERALTKEDIHINFKIPSYLLYLNIFLHEIKIKICKIYTAFPVFFANAQCYSAEFYMV